MPACSQKAVIKEDFAEFPLLATTGHCRVLAEKKIHVDPNQRKHRAFLIRDLPTETVVPGMIRGITGALIRAWENANA